MSKERNIATIKKEIMDKLINNEEIYNYLTHFDRYDEEGYSIDKMYNNFIYDYDSSNKAGNYITVEVDERERIGCVNIGDKTYTVRIRMSLNYEENIDALSYIIADIVNKLYPGNRNYHNVSFRYSGNLGREIAFKING